ncbi:MAG: tRNA dihydrouridine synthase DusB [Fimbriimonadaceae bacterium]|nr:tRNA dihydrouridine synthase DusB [Fimbriimonadaceae bacterium]
MSHPGFRIGGVRVEPPLVLAPMEDVSNLAFRRIAKRIGGPGLMFSEFVSAMAIHYGATKTFRKLRVHPEERPLGIQIFGGDPDVMAETARFVETYEPDLIDINMGCWVPKVCRTGSGAALLKDPELAERIVRAVVRAVRVPVTVKVRAGWDFSLFAAPELAKRFEDAGAKAITLHARFAKQGFEGQADWDLIRRLRESVTVPVIGNGDVRSPADALRLLEETGCHGVMVGRAAISNPWSLAAIRAVLVGETAPPPPTIHDRIAAAIEHARLMVAYEAEVDAYEDTIGFADRIDLELRAIRALRGQLPLYIKGEPGSAQVRERLSRASSVAEVEDLLGEWRSPSR